MQFMHLIILQITFVYFYDIVRLWFIETVSQKHLNLYVLVVASVPTPIINRIHDGLCVMDVRDSGVWNFPDIHKTSLLIENIY